MPRILVVAPNWIGDALMAQPLLGRLHERTPVPEIDVLAPEWVAPVVRRMAQVLRITAGRCKFFMSTAQEARREAGQDLRSRIGRATSGWSTTKANIARSPHRPRNRWP